MLSESRGQAKRAWTLKIKEGLALLDKNENTAASVRIHRAREPARVSAVKSQSTLGSGKVKS